MRLYTTISEAINNNLDRKGRIQGMWIVVLLIFSAMLDFVGIASLFPLMAAVIDPASSSNIIAALSARFNSHTTFIIAMSVAVFAIVAFKNAITLLIARKKIRFAYNVRTSIAEHALSQFANRKYTDFANADFARELHRVNNYPLAFASYILLPVGTIISESIIIFMIVTFMMLYNPEMALITALFLIPLGVLFYWRKNALKNINDDFKRTHPDVLKTSAQVIEGYVEIKTYHKPNFFLDRFNKASRKLAEVCIRDQTFQAVTLRLTETFVVLILVALIIYSVLAKMPYQQTLLLIGIYTAATFRLIPSVNRIQHGLQQIRVNEHVAKEFQNGFKEYDQRPPHQQTSFGQAIELRNVTFAYSTQNKPLAKISLSIKKGDKIAITGASGEGKTTLLLLLAGMLPPAEGDIFVDGTSIVSTAARLDKIAYVSQNPYIIDGSIIENIAFGINEEFVDLKLVNQLIDQLGLREMLNLQPNGIKTTIGERGARISGGQRQRIAIARALYANADFLLLDEITSQVDNLLEHEIMSFLSTLQDKTIVMVTHKTSLLKFFDHVYTLEKGQLLELEAVDGQGTRSI